jgi:hypothetical protein
LPLPDGALDALLSRLRRNAETLGYSGSLEELEAIRYRRGGSKASLR